MNPEFYPLYSIAESDLYNQQVESKLRIPNIQRGLVWKSLQVELLWDSILRGFPIGSMLILDKEGEPSEILDGQQRANAIINGFDADWLIEPSTSYSKNSKSILWYDLGYKPQDIDGERRLFGIRLINSSHPWGYQANGDKLEAEKRRNARDEAYQQKRKNSKEENEEKGKNIPKKKSDWDIRKFLPYNFTLSDSFLPIPLPFLVKAAKGKNIKNKEDISAFFSQIKGYINAFASISPWWASLYQDKVLSFINNHQEDYSFCNTFFALNDYSVVFNYVTTKDDIEILFNRVNSKGTPMSSAELTYAAIKHYGSKLCDCNSIGEVIKTITNGFLPEVQLAQIIFRWCYSNDHIKGDIDARTIRKLAIAADGNDVTVSNKLRELFSNSGERLKELLSIVKQTILEKDNLPAVMLAEIGMKKPNLFILVLALIENEDHRKSLGTDFIRALSFYLYCFAINDNPIQMIYEANSKDSVDLKSEIQNIIRDSISHEWCIELPDSFKEFKALKDSELNKDWSMEKYSDQHGYYAFKSLFEYESYQGAFMIKFAQRKFYNDVFGEYNPANKELWEDINRPWDHDHIIPKSWLNKNDWAKCENCWLNSWGNIADIPFEENRGKGDNPDWSYYKSVKKDYEDDVLLTYDFCNKVSRDEITQDGLVKGIDSIVKQFLLSTRDRFLKISNEFITLFDVLGITDKLSPMQEERKAFLNSVGMMAARMDGSLYQFFYLTPSGIEKEITDDVITWQKPWVSLIRKESSTWKWAITIYILHEKGDAKFLVRRGNRKDPEVELVANNNTLWESGSDFYCEPKHLQDNEKCSDYLRYFTLGATILNQSTGLTGFVSDSSGLISFKGIFDEIDVKLRVYRYYSHYYIEVKVMNECDNLPKKILDYGKENDYSIYNDAHIERELYHINVSAEKLFEKFKEIVQKMQTYTQIL